MIVGEDRDARARTQFLFREPAAHGFRHAARFGVSVALDLVVALDFEGDRLRPVLLTGDKLVVKGGHEGSGKYT